MITDETPPLDSEKPVIRVSLSTTILAGVGSMIATAGVTWGIYSQRIVALEKSDTQQGPVLQSHDRQLAVIQTQYIEISRRLELIDRKLDNK